MELETDKAKGREEEQWHRVELLTPENLSAV